jgi:hypothetical protein
MGVKNPIPGRSLILHLEDRTDGVKIRLLGMVVKSAGEQLA